MWTCGVVVGLLLSLNDASGYRSSEGSIGGLSASGLGCRWSGESDSSGTGTAGVRICYTAYQSQVGIRARQRAPAAAVFCQQAHDGWLATVPNEVTQNWLESALNLKYVSQNPSRPLQLIGEFWFGAELVGLRTRRWSWSDRSGSTFGFTNWQRNYPMSTTRNTCAYMEPTRPSTDVTRWLWKNDACYKTKNFICEHRERNQSAEIQGCGRPAVDPNVYLRVVNGVQAEPHSWPWMVSFQGRMNDTEFVHLCGGSLISDRWVLTAAHCQEHLDFFHFRRAVVGLHWLRYPKPGTRDYSVHAEISHLVPSPSYNHSTHRNDIMLVELTHPVTFNDAVSPVCFPGSTQTVSNGIRCYTSGWGSTGEGLTGYDPNVLRQVELLIIDRRTCNQRLWYNGRIDDTMLCAGYEQGGRDSCQGDSGGALVCLDDDHWVQYGVTSWGIGCGAVRKPGVYAQVSIHRRWIDQTIRESSTP